MSRDKQTLLPAHDYFDIWLRLFELAYPVPADPINSPKDFQALKAMCVGFARDYMILTE